MKIVKSVVFRGAEKLCSVAISDEGMIRDLPSPGNEVLDAGGLFMPPRWADLHVRYFAANP